ncbi:hypothetical protein [Caballeronia sp. dw_276]|jgi:hypothetical protein|nr:hypothetical protein [Caballeronia sp. dw_276]
MQNLASRSNRVLRGFNLLCIPACHEPVNDLGELAVKLEFRERSDLFA